MVNSTRLSVLQRENTALRARVSDFEKQVAELRGEVRQLSDLDGRIRLLADLEQIDPDVKRAGTGGFEPKRSIEGLGPGIAASTGALESDIDQLIREAALTKASFTEVADKLAKRRELWSCIPSIQPTSGYALHDFGFRRDPFTGRRTFHAGLDILAPRGTPIVASADGIVTYAGARGGYGLCVEINHGYGYETRYGHCSYIKARPGQKVKRGQIIALVGSTGRTTGPHLHYEVTAAGNTINPQSFILTGQCFD
jgi:murein DD-endopeptidase MepM/ murein hydrolase activator NlpD